MTDPSGSQQRWLRERAFLNARRHELARTAQDLYPRSWRVAGTPMLARPGWIPAAPVPLDRVTLSWHPGETGPVRDGPVLPVLDGPVLDGPVLDGPVLDGPVLDAPVLDGTGPESAAVRPMRGDGRRFGCYADALGALNRPGLFENRACYRLLEVRGAPEATSLEFGAGRYFDVINTGEAVAHEYAAAALSVGNPGRPAVAELPLRSLIGDPTDLRPRPVLTAGS